MRLVFSAILVAVGFMGSSVGAEPQKKAENSRKPASISASTPSFTSFYGKRYLVPSANHNCNVGQFKDHDSSVKLCIDSSGNPILAH
jgi:hypothetical protein